ncbi:PP2C family serine/threonine-protein phosphatase [Streptomyces sp. NPDC052236]|uniref:PP2C family serine/threonine-protein phosphatase n=1 Tax=Streptomyces sp. NPDC052236 TaxID=3365686 RepID=UPI0037D4045D
MEHHKIHHENHENHEIQDVGWDILNGSVQGPAKPLNQDWSDAEITPDGALVLAVADGHGSAAHPLSHLGARYAVDVFKLCGADFAARARQSARQPGGGGLRRLWADAHDRVPRELVRTWQDWVVKRHHGEPGEPRPATPDLLRAYGTTLIGAVLTEGLFAAWQLGDGDLMVVDADGTIAQPLAPATPELGDETESMCSRQAWDLVRVHWAPVSDPARLPRLVALSTDGLSNSFAARDGFVRFVREMDQRITAEGTGPIGEALPEWLARAGSYSGDDTTAVVARLRRPAAAAALSETED